MYFVSLDPFCHRPAGGATASRCQADEKENRWEPRVWRTLTLPLVSDPYGQSASIQTHFNNKWGKNCVKFLEKEFIMLIQDLSFQSIMDFIKGK